MSNYFKKLDKEKARKQDVGYQEYILQNHTSFIGFGGTKPDLYARAFDRATTYQNLGHLPSLKYVQEPNHFWDDWETNLAIEALEESVSIR